MAQIEPERHVEGASLEKDAAGLAPFRTSEMYPVPFLFAHAGRVNYVLMSGASEADSFTCVISTHVDDASG